LAALTVIAVLFRAGQSPNIEQVAANRLRTATPWNATEPFTTARSHSVLSTSPDFAELRPRSNRFLGSDGEWNP